MISVKLCTPMPDGAGSTVRVAAVDVPFSVAVICTWVRCATAAVLMLNAAVADPAGTATDAGTLATAGLLLASEIAIPAVGALPER